MEERGTKKEELSTKRREGRDMGREGERGVKGALGGEQKEGRLGRRVWRV